jgi:hypothetical protein
MVTHVVRQSNRDFVPVNAAVFGAWVHNINAYITPARAQQWAIPADVMDEFRTKTDDFLTIQDSLPIDASRAQLAARNAAKRELTALLRGIVKFYLRRKIVADPDLIAMGIPPLDNIRTMRTSVTEGVEFVLRLNYFRQIVVDFWQQGVEHSKAKPTAYDGAVIVWNIGSEQPAKVADFKYHAMASRRPFTIEFADAERGKTVWFALAWQNKRGIRGKWSDFKSAIIP